MNIQLSDHFTYGRLLRFTFPTIVMMIFTSIYGVVDGIFVSNYAGKTAFAAINLIMPYLMVFGTIGFMIGSGGTALISMTLGMGDRKKANELFSMLTYLSIAGGIILTVISVIFMRPAAIALGATGQMLEDCVLYGNITQVALTAYVLQFAFQSFCITAEKPNLSLTMMVTAGVCNIVLDALLVAVFRWGLVGAAVATATAQIVGAVIPLVYFLRPNDSLLQLGKCRFDGKALLRTCTNGSSELMSNLSMSLVSMLYNLQLIKYAGENGIAAYGTMMYVNFVFLAAFIGYSIGTAPVIGFHFGAQNHSELKSLLRNSLGIIGAVSLAMLVMGLVLAAPLSELFVGYDRELTALTIRGFTIFALSFLFAGFAIFTSGFFTALNDGLTSALISFLRTMVFQIAAVLLLPLVWGIDGIWWSIVAAEAMAVAVGICFLLGKQKKYQY